MYRFPVNNSAVIGLKPLSLFLAVIILIEFYFQIELMLLFPVGFLFDVRPVRLFCYSAAIQEKERDNDASKTQLVMSVCNSEKMYH